MPGKGISPQSRAARLAPTDPAGRGRGGRTVWQEAPSLGRAPARGVDGRGGGQAASLLGKLAPAGTLEPRAGPCGALCASPAAWLWSPPLQGPSHVTSLSRPRQDPPQREDGKGVLPEPSWNSERDQGPRGDVRAAEEGSVDSAKRPEGATWDDRIH